MQCFGCQHIIINITCVLADVNRDLPSAVEEEYKCSRQTTERGTLVEKTRCAAKATKDASILRQHRQVWITEWSRLKKAEEDAETELQDFQDQIGPANRHISLRDYELVLEKERESFWLATVEPALQLKDELNFRASQLRQQKVTAGGSDQEQVLQKIKSAKERQDSIGAKLHADYLALEEQINHFDMEKCSSPSDSLVSPGKVPKEVLDSDCPDPVLKESLIRAFHSLTERYQQRCQSLQEQLESADRLCGWTADEHQRFLLTLSQYSHGIPKHRELCMDMLQRLFPRRTRRELQILQVEHERALDRHHFAQVQLRTASQQWHRDHEQLLARALVTLEEARHAHQEELEHHRDRRHQREVCSQLREKLQQWRAQQEEVAKLEAAIAARQQEGEEERLKREQRKERVARSQQKEKIMEFNLKQKKRMEVVERRDQERLANLRAILEEQARRDRKRVKFRAYMLLQRKEEREARELERQREREEREYQLEALRKQVEVVAEPDPERMMSHTESWKSQLLNVQEFGLQKPLFSINTYTDRQILSDPRVRIELALREAGVHHSRYAKEVMSTIKPLKPPRPENKSTLQL
ncbi:coiled-coil domain-containing protein 148-like isoform X1 [Nelusetta ayraudi]|uniref:coiled-coil domain-containing protein 148-like isoform X1 n=1 Tax=Nelusetta ayraudi TaxID=303726 RepID=UPI003F6E4AE5